MSTPCLHLTDLWLADGSGKDPVKSELLISQGIIQAVGSSDIGSGAGEKLSCKNLIASPGFIDVHGHSDISSLLDNNLLFSRISQGITCEIAGNCGLSAFPVTEKNAAHLEELYAKYHQQFKWSSCSQLRSFAAEKNLPCSIEYLTGHNTLRAAVAGYDSRELSGSETEIISSLLSDTLDQGALGLSLGLLYVPGRFYTCNELIQLFKTVAKHKKIVACHLKSEGNQLLESLEEMINLSLESGLKKFHISHFKTAGKKNFHKLSDAFEMIKDAALEGVDITFDRYPYTQSMTQLSLVLPDEWSDIDDVSITEKLQDNEICRQLINEMHICRNDEYWKSVTLVNTPLHSYDHCRGLTLDKLSDDPAAGVVEILRCSSPAATAAFSGMSNENMLRIITDPRCMAGSDGTALPPDGSFGYDHPRSSGAVCRFLRLLLDNNIPIAEAVRKVTGLPADTFALPSAGCIRPGNIADITIFDPDEIDGTSTFADPVSPAKGIKAVIKHGIRLL